MVKPKCFVISPIGAPGSDVRAHADDVFDYIIKPVLEELGYAPHRGDHNARPGRISDQMYDSILHDDLLIAILTYQNPNVYYELAIAHAAARPLIILCEASHALPFDIKDQRVIFYDLRPRSLFEGTYKDELRKAIEQLRTGGVPQEVPFRPSLSPLGGLGESFRIFDRYIDAISGGMQHIKLLDEAQNWFNMSGIAMQSIGLSSDFMPALERAAQRKLKVFVMIMDAKNEALPAMLNTSFPDHVGKVRDEIARSYSFWLGIAERMPNVAVTKVSRGVIYQCLFMNERRMLYTPYCLSDNTYYAPAIQCDYRSALYIAQQKEFDFVWRANAGSKSRPHASKGTRKQV
jgi:hypothetical protein